MLDQPGGDQIDTIVLACTHFPLVADELAAAAPRPLRFVDGGPGIARRVSHLTQGQQWPEIPSGTAVFTAPLDLGMWLRDALAANGLETISIL